jgi:hypothetical protein
MAFAAAGQAFAAANETEGYRPDYGSKLRDGAGFSR